MTGEGKSRVLVVDDQVDLANLIRLQLQRGGYEVSTASSAEEALQTLISQAFDVVLTDIALPGMTGLDLAAKLAESTDTDIIVMTGFVGKYSYEEVIGKGASDFILKPVNGQELILRLSKVLAHRELRLAQDKLMKEYQSLIITDHLTKLSNSRHFYDQLAAEIRRSTRYARTLSLLLLDIDHFKTYNDTFGHLAGDRVLTGIGQAIRECLRGMDTAYRYGGEEFTVILPETDAEEAVTVGERIRETIESRGFSPEAGKNVALSISVGVTEYNPGEDITSFIGRADKAMYSSKANGRNRVSLITVDQEPANT